MFGVPDNVIIYGKTININEVYSSNKKLLKTINETKSINKQFVKKESKNISNLLKKLQHELELTKTPKIKKLKFENNQFKKDFKIIKNRNFDNPPEESFKDLIFEYKKKGYKIPSLSTKHNLFEINPLIEENDNRLINGIKLEISLNKIDKKGEKSLNYLHKLNFIVEEQLNKFHKEKFNIEEHEFNNINNNYFTERNFFRNNFDEENENEKILQKIQILLKLIEIENENFKIKEEIKRNKTFNNKIKKFDLKNPNNLKLNNQNHFDSNNNLKINLLTKFNKFQTDRSLTKNLRNLKKKQTNYSIKSVKSVKSKKIINTNYNFSPLKKQLTKNNLKLSIPKLNFENLNNNNNNNLNNQIIFENSSRNSRNINKIEQFNSDSKINNQNSLINLKSNNFNSNSFLTKSTNFTYQNCNKNILNSQKEEYLKYAYNKFIKEKYNLVEEILKNYLIKFKKYKMNEINEFFKNYDMNNIMNNIIEIKKITNKKNIIDKSKRIYLREQLYERIKKKLDDLKIKHQKINRMDKNFVDVISK